MTNPAFENLRLNLNMLYDPATALERGESLFLEREAPVSQNETRQEAQATTAPRLSEENPYNCATFTHELIQIASRLADTIPSCHANGISALLTVIEERSNALSYMLDQRKFCEDWTE